MKIAPRLARCMLLLLFCCGCGGRPRIGPVNADSIVLCFGDSLTAGSGVTGSQSYPAILAELLGCRVLNAGVGGEVSAEGLRRLPAVLKQHRPDLVILCHGGNDLLRQLRPSEIATNLAGMIALIRESGADVVLVGVPKPSLLLRTADLYKDIAVKHQVPLESRIVAKILSRPSLKNDQIHPNARGNRLLAEAVAKLIMRSQG